MTIAILRGFKLTCSTFVTCRCTSLPTLRSLPGLLLT